MADRAAEVRLIAIRKRAVTPLLSGSSYAAATRAAKAPAPFRPFLKRRSVEGFLFPSTYFFEPSSSAASLVSAADRDIRAALGDDRPSGSEGAQADAVRRPDHRVAGREGDRRAERAHSRRRGDREPARAGHAARDRCVAPVRPRCPGHAPAQAVASPEQHAVQHPPLQGPAADSDHESRPALDACGSEARERRLPLLRPQAGRRAPLLHGGRAGVLRRRPWSMATPAASAGPLRGAVRRRRPSRARCGRPRRPSRAGRRPGRPPRA